jgi:hypothetical protein
MPDSIHIQEDDLELYSAGHLEPERIPALESHLSDCRDCQERLHQCIGPQLEAIRKPHSGQGGLHSLSGHSQRGKPR